VEEARDQGFALSRARETRARPSSSTFARVGVG
jgi:hypothetical protein